MYGWRLKIGTMIPSVNSVVENEFSILAPEGVSVFCTRMAMKGKNKVEQLASMADSLEEYAISLSDVADIYAYACTSGSFLRGPEWDKEIIDRIQKLTGKQAVSASGALTQALNTLKVKKVALATPYINEVNEKQVKYLNEMGFEVSAVKGLNITARGGAGLCNPDIAYKLGRDIVKDSNAEVLVISCTNFRTIEVIKMLEEDLGIPVITSNQALFWATLRKSGIQDRIPNTGRLLQEF